MTLRDALERNDFTNINPNDLPVAIPHLAKHAERSPDEMLLESFGFAIMSRNIDLVSHLLLDILNSDIDLSTIYPLHLAIDYLDGSKTCCKIVETLSDKLDDSYRIKDLYTNDSGHTLIDSLMMAIIRSHTDLTPSILDEAIKEKRFRGDEISICGRWDADSDCTRKLLSSGFSKAPSNWKHKFCHTSVQAICHSMWHLQFWYRDTGFPQSGLFQKRCTNCGLKLELSQLHTLVIVTYLLAEAGCEDEDLFGMISSLLCLISPLETSDFENDVSLTLLFDMEADSMTESCTHQKLNAEDFARELRSFRTRNWTEKCATGWELFQLLLDRSQRASKAFQIDPEMHREEPMCKKHYIYNVLCGDSKLATIWAAMQAELLTYRRLHLTDAWLSNNFDIAKLLNSLKNDEELSLALPDLTEPRDCSCGAYILRTEDVDTREISNFSYLDDPERTGYVMDDY
ncbi:hypothetical protein SLS56_001982 [Neofusicoccum ribis]|uniref:Ankyrin repeat protein n=1 Tax=Neofusicoccum ribis TaxID=45134 RepID=A0ABR3T6C0_9PEZI